MRILKHTTTVLFASALVLGTSLPSVALTDSRTTPRNSYGVSGIVTATWSTTTCTNNVGNRLTAYRLDSWSAQYTRTYTHRSALVKFKTRAGQTGLVRCYGGKATTNPYLTQVKTTADEVATWPSTLTSAKRTYTRGSNWQYYYMDSGAVSNVQMSALTYEAFGYPSKRLCGTVSHPAVVGPSGCSVYPAG